MALGDGRLGTWQALLTITMLIIPLSAHGRHSLARHRHHHNQSSVSKDTLNARMVLSEDSAEREHLIGAGLGHGARLRLGSNKRHYLHKHARLDVIEEDPPVGEELTAGGAGSEQPGSQLSDDVITVEFHSPAPDIVPADVATDWAKALKPQKQKGGDPATWTLSDFYDYLSPDDELSALGATPAPEPTPSPPADMEDENPHLDASPATPDKVRPSTNSGPSLSAPSVPGLEKGDDSGLGGAMGADGCRLGFVRSGPGACVPQCETEPNFCFNGGVCTVVAGTGAFCRCNVQDYIWNKGTRCDWAVTEFQVMCAVVGVASVVLLLLIMIIIFFAKRLHHLKNENKRLRRRSKYRPQSSEPQTDGLSVSTTVDGSQPNVRKLCDTPPLAPQAHTHNLAYYDNIICQLPSTTSYTWEYKPRNPYNHFQDDPQKQEDPAKSPQAKEEGSMNILNSYSPKHENHRPTSVDRDQGHTPNNAEETAEEGVTIGLEVLPPKDAKLHSETSPPVQYDIFLCSVGNNGATAPPSKVPPSNVNHHSSPPKSPKHTKEHPTDDHEPLSGRHPSPSHHSAPGCESSPSCHPPFQNKCMPTSFSTPPRGPSDNKASEHSTTGRGFHSGCIHPSPSSPHLTQPPPSPTGIKYSPVSSRSLPSLS